ncbi:unnamed protein product [Rotaria magnacalcarata]|uniref:Uncharacterized protein n=4 Tax=Rotaria magnacalcarata TaxID=392030 RepID=A0A819A1P6_9BILA|nr:unnamed protein product [Rotaria magnacalcarata]CAF1539926.1 unnamed protein product [Rotaria magnacalcarata]CAF2053450.1 unnamed protein product [Rotaria magnacalcarata]CAF2076546.1 unnamed protein product [Rotaria magnacalcarata]CAF2130391.1 unnamed protein product [Rotaria magnacalcarata]
MGTNAEFNLRFTKKMIEKEASAAEKKYDTSRKKALDALKKTGDVETARIYAETAIQNRTAHNQFLIMASRIDSVIAKVQQANAQSVMVKNMKQVNKMLEHVNQEMNAGELAKVMEKFEQAFEDFDVKEQVMSNAMNQAMATSTPTEGVQELLRQIADENNLDIRSQLDAIPAIQNSVVTPAQQVAATQNSRLAALRHAT